MKRKTAEPEHQAILERIGYACIKGAQFSDLNQFLGAVHRIRLMISDLHNAVVAEQQKIKEKQHG